MRYLLPPFQIIRLSKNLKIKRVYVCIKDIVKMTIGVSRQVKEETIIRI